MKMILLNTIFLYFIVSLTVKDAVGNDSCTGITMTVSCNDFYRVDSDTNSLSLISKESYKFCLVLEAGTIDLEGNLKKECMGPSLTAHGVSKVKVAKIIKECSEKGTSPANTAAKHFDCTGRILKQRDKIIKDQ